MTETATKPCSSCEATGTEYFRFLTIQFNVSKAIELVKSTERQTADATGATLQ